MTLAYSKARTDTTLDFGRDVYCRLAELCLEMQDVKSEMRERDMKAGFDCRTEQTRIKALEEIVQLNRVVSMGLLAASLAHELAQPLAAIGANAQAAKRLASLPQPDLAEIRAALADITENDQRAQSVVHNMRAVFQKRHIALQELDLNRVVNDVIRLIEHEAQLRGIRIRLLFSSEPVTVLGDNCLLQQVVLNLANNGMEAVRDLPAERRILSLTTRAAAGVGSILVEDHGLGIPDGVKPELFNPFFTTKSNGLGIGLSICRSLVEFLQGRIRLEERHGPGTAFLVELPLAAQKNNAKVA